MNRTLTKVLDEVRWGAVDPIARAALGRLARALPAPRVIYDRDGGAPYLSRWYLTGTGRAPDVGGVLGREQVHRGIGPLARLSRQTYLHRFHRDDDDLALHSHPWAWAVSIVMAGGYHEERRVGDRVERRTVPPGSINFLRADDYHRVELLADDAWSIFFCGPKVDTWYFWDRDLKARMPWREFIARKRGPGLPCGFVHAEDDEPCVLTHRHEFHAAADRSWWNKRDAKLLVGALPPDAFGPGWIPDRREP